jgi:hypothetical protein
MVNRCTREVTDGHVSLPEVRVPEVRVPEVRVPA